MACAESGKGGFDDQHGWLRPWHLLYQRHSSGIRPQHRPKHRAFRFTRHPVTPDGSKGEP
jgi:hypothetical protein